jgi:membrane protein implicated in regulation of membrane protease activity
MEAYVWWVIVGIGLIVAELMTGTFLLLILGVAALAGAAIAYFNLSFWLQVIAAVAVGSAGMLWVSRVHGRSMKTARGRDEHILDIGQMVELESWVSEVDGLARVRYRNASWDAHVQGERTPGGKVFYICAMDGNTLHVSSTRPVPS